MEKFRKVEVFKDNEWLEIQFKELEVDNRFRMFEPDGSPVLGSAGITEWVVTKGPYRRDEDGVWTVEYNEGEGDK